MNQWFKGRFLWGSGTGSLGVLDAHQGALSLRVGKSWNLRCPFGSFESQLGTWDWDWACHACKIIKLKLVLFDYLKNKNIFSSTSTLRFWCRNFASRFAWSLLFLNRARCNFPKYLGQFHDFFQIENCHAVIQKMTLKHHACHVEAIFQAESLPCQFSRLPRLPRLPRLAYFATIRIT